MRRDIEGLRAIAIGLVLLHHLGVPFTPGGFVGVDIFFVISGFAITARLLREIEQSGSLSLRSFYARGAKRLLPVACLVLVCTTAMVWVAGSGVDWRLFGGDVVASAAYVINWRLADRSVDHLAEDVGASPVQHFWPLAVEAQFYLVWPVLILLSVWATRRMRQQPRRLLAVGVMPVLMVSLLWSISMTAAEPARAYFITPTRMWELALGAAVAIATPYLVRIPRAPSVVMGWVGLVVIGVAGLQLERSVPWPGAAALLPTVAAATVIAAGAAAGRYGPISILGSPPFVLVGGLSYSIYLWHWPVIRGVEDHAGLSGLAKAVPATVITFALAWLSYRFVENPIRHSNILKRSPGLAISVGGNLTLLSITAGLALVIAFSTAIPRDDGSVDASGSRALGSDPGSYVAPTTLGNVVPDPTLATQDMPPGQDDCQVKPNHSAPIVCQYGDADGKTEVALIGDSKIRQWLSAFDTIGRENGWLVKTYTKSGCPYADVWRLRDGRIFTDCHEWNVAVHDLLYENLPDVVVTSQRSNQALVDPNDPDGDRSVDVMAAALRERWQELIDVGVTVVVLRDNPSPYGFENGIYSCVAEHPNDLQLCSFDRARAESESGGVAQLQAARGFDGAHVVDLNDYICPGDTCPPVIGNVLIYRQGSHLTRTYVDTLTQRLKKELEHVVEEES